MKHRWIVAIGALAMAGCNSPTVGGVADFCMQWVNTSTRVVQFHAVDDVGDTLSVVTLMVPNIGDSFASAKLHLRGAGPIRFSTTNGFNPITLRPTGGSKVLIVEASRVSTTLEHYEDNGTCP
jgi:hypothetical protein